MGKAVREYIDGGKNAAETAADHGLSLGVVRRPLPLLEQGFHRPGVLGRAGDRALPTREHTEVRRPPSRSPPVVAPLFP